MSAPPPYPCKAMDFVTLDGLKKHLRVDYDDEDQLITELADAAEADVLNYTCRDVEYFYDHGDRALAAVRAVVYLLVADSYEQRTAGRPSSLGNPLAAVAYKLNPYRRLV